MRNSKEFIELFPLSMLICEDCALGQLSYDVKQQILFEDYRYTSSTSGTMLQHSKNYVDEILKIINFSKSDYVLEIACNDGYLLNFFALLDINSVGIDPATNIISLIKNPRITTINSFFTLKTAELILSEFGYPKLIIANNVLAHVPDINDFMSSLSLLCQDETLITIENPSLRILKERLQFDTIYHEHFSYLSACAMNTLCQQNNLELLSIKKLEIHGGSNRYYISKSHGLSLENNVSTEIALERQHGLNFGLTN
jgi:hypothetical protein